ncbi:MAG TPA: hypothetical protein VF644_19010 [Pyrinomonadaceae bacterium]|jgi:hypothetical protein
MRKPKFIFALIFAAALATACSGEANPDRAGRGNSANANSAVQMPQTPLEIELARLQRANFRQIIAFSRKDGGKITDEDKEYFREYAPSMQINQRLVTDDDQYFVAGTNFVFTPEQLDALGKRFAIEDFTEKYGRKLETPTPKKEN